MADEPNIPSHRWYQDRYHIKLPMEDVSESVIKAAGVRKIDQAIVSPIFAASERGVWFDPSDISTLFQDSAGTTPVTAAGQPVGLMMDKSGRGNHATQATSASRPTYQVDSAGRPYISFDGVDDSMVTGTITPAIDKVQVFAGLRMMSSAAFGILAEFSASLSANAGSFNLQAPLNTNNYRFASRGSLTGSTPTTGSTFTAPVTSVVSGTSDISGDLSILRVDGAQQSTSAVDQGTGNYLAYPLYIGRRGGASAPFNGFLYSLIVRFGANMTADQIASTENWVNAKTGAF